MLRKLVVNADDLGLTVGINKGIFDAHHEGIVTSASMMANASATSDAISRLRSHPSLGIGAHLVLVDGVPMLPPNRIPSLVDGDEGFRSSWRSFIVASLRGRVSLNEVESELTAQIDRIRSEGIRLTHLDAHKHVHAFPPLFEVVVRLAARFHIPVVRVPYERWSPVWGDRQQRCRVWCQALANAAMGPWAGRDVRLAGAHGVDTPELVGRIHTGVMSADSLAGMIRRLRPGVTELMVHPGYVDDALGRHQTRLLSSRAAEVDLLCSRSVADLVLNEDIELVRHDLGSSDMLLPRSFRGAS